MPGIIAKPNSPPDKELVKVFEAAGVVEFLEYLQSGKRILWINFKAGMAKGLGMAVGVAVILGLLIWILTLLVDLPVVGEYFGQAKQYITDYAENTNYKDEFVEMNESPHDIKENIAEVIEPDTQQEQVQEPPPQ